MEEQFDKEIHALAQQIKGLHDQAELYIHLWWTTFVVGWHR